MQFNRRIMEMASNPGAHARKQRLDRFLQCQADVCESEPNKNLLEPPVANGSSGQPQQPTSLPPKFIDSLPAFYKGVLEASVSKRPGLSSHQQNCSKTSRKPVKPSSKKLHRPVPYDQSHRIHTPVQESLKTSSHKNVYNTLLNHVKVGSHNTVTAKIVQKNSSSSPPPQMKALHSLTPASPSNVKPVIRSSPSLPPHVKPAVAFGLANSRWTGCLPPPPKPISPVKAQVSHSGTDKAPPRGNQSTAPLTAVKSFPFNPMIKSSKANLSRHSNNLPKQRPKTSKASNHSKVSSYHKKPSMALPIAVNKLCKANSNVDQSVNKQKAQVSKVKQTSGVDGIQTEKAVVPSLTVNHTSSPGAKIKAGSGSQSVIPLAHSKPNTLSKSIAKSKTIKTKSTDFVASPLINKRNQPLVRLVPLKKTQELVEQVKLLTNNNTSYVSRKQTITKIKQPKVKSKEVSSADKRPVTLPVASVKKNEHADNKAISPNKQKGSPSAKKSRSGVEVKDGKVQLPIAMDKIKLLIAEQKSQSNVDINSASKTHGNIIEQLPSKGEAKVDASSRGNGVHPVALTKLATENEVHAAQRKNGIDPERNASVVVKNIIDCESNTIVPANSQSLRNCETTNSLSSGGERQQPSVPARGGVDESNSTLANDSKSKPPKRAIPKLKTRRARLMEKSGAAAAAGASVSVCNGTNQDQLSNSFQITGEETQTVISLETTIEGQVVASIISEESEGVLEYVSTCEKQDSTQVMIPPLTCQMCMLSFHCFDTFMRHKWSHCGVRGRCPRYPKKTKVKKQSLKKQFGYRVVQQTKRPYMCDICGKNFVRRRDVIIHLRVHTGEKPFVCQLCNKGFSQNSQLKRHQDSHSGLKPFACDLCGNSYSRKDGLKRHMITHSGLRPYSCNLCGATFTYSSTLGEHMAQHRGDRPHKCSFCPQTFIKKIRLIEHERIHTGTKPFVCHICNAGFTATRLLNSHKKIHAEVKPFSCDICHKGFTQRGALTKHAVCHTNDKPWKCEECGKGFGQQQYLKNHMKIHSDVKPYKCVHCGWGFRDKTSHVRHERLHTGVRPFKCERCEKSFNRSTHLKKHMQCHKKYDAIRKQNLLKKQNEMCLKD